MRLRARVFLTGHRTEREMMGNSEMTNDAKKKWEEKSVYADGGCAVATVSPVAAL